MRQHRLSGKSIFLNLAEEKSFTTLKKISDMRYYYAINKQRLRTDGKLFAKIKKQVTERAEEELKTLNETLESQVARRTAELRHSKLDILWRLAKAGEYRDENTGNHVVRVGCYSRTLAEEMQMPMDVEALSDPHAVSEVHAWPTTRGSSFNRSSYMRATSARLARISGRRSICTHPSAQAMSLRR